MQKTKNSKKVTDLFRHEWDLSLFYNSAEDPQIEKDAESIEKAYFDFAQKYDTADKAYLKDDAILLSALTEYEEMLRLSDAKPLMYFLFSRDLNSDNKEAGARVLKLENRFVNASNKIIFFSLDIGGLPKQKQDELLSNKSFEHFHYFLKRAFMDAKHNLPVEQEKILSLKNTPAYNMWVSHTNKLLNSQTVSWKGKDMAVPAAFNTIPSLRNPRERALLAKRVSIVLKDVGRFAEGEINAVVTDKKIEDELRGFSKPYDSTILSYRNNSAVVEGLVKTVSSNFKIAQRFYKLKAKLLKQKKLNYCDRSAPIGTINKKFDFEESYERLLKVFEKVSPEYSRILEQYYSKRQIDVFPRKGKKGGAYCWSTFGSPTFVLLNHVGDLHSFSTFAHEMGHAIHSELVKGQGPLYFRPSMSLAETASTLFETIALDSIFEELTDKEKIIVLHDKINDDISTIFRQIACFNFESDIHHQVRKVGYIEKEEIAQLHNKNMSAYLGPVFKLEEGDGYMFVQWSHIRRFFYVYTYAYGQLVSKALIRRYKADKSFWSSIEKLLSSGGKASPEDLLLEIGIDVSSGDFFLEGLREIEDDIKKLEKLTKN